MSRDVQSFLLDVVRTDDLWTLRRLHEEAGAHKWLFLELDGLGTTTEFILEERKAVLEGRAGVLSPLMQQLVAKAAAVEPAREWPSQMVRSLSVAERIELRLALSARRLRVSELPAKRMARTMAVLDGLLGSVEDLRFEVNP